MDYSVLEGLVDESQPASQAEGKGSKAEKRLQRQAQRSAEREQSQRPPAEAAAVEVPNPRSVKPGKGSAASFLLPPSDVPADKAGAFVEQLVLERQAREARQAEARLMARGGRDTQQQQQQHQQQQGQQQHIYHQHRILPCHHYQRGHCSYGDSCHYSHDVPQFPAASSAPSRTAGGSDHPGHTRPGSAGSSASGGAGSGRVRADGLTQEQLSGVRAAANTQDPLLTREALARLGKRPDDMPFYKTVMCNFWKHQGFCPRGDSCTYAHGEADKRPQYSGTDVRRKDPRPAHYQQPQQQQQQHHHHHQQQQQQQQQRPQQQQPQKPPAPAADPAELMRQVAAASGRTAAGAGGAQQRPRPYRPYSPQMGTTSNTPPGPTQPQPQPPPPAPQHQQPAAPRQQQQADVPAAFQLPASHPRGSSAPQQRSQPPPPPMLAPRPASAHQSKSRQQQQQPQQQRQQPRQSQAQHLHKQIGKQQQSGFAQQSAFGLLATSDDDRSDAGSDAGSSGAVAPAPAVAAPAQVPAQNGHVNKTGLANVMAELNIDSDEDLDEEVLGSFFCPVTQELLKDPVVAADGHTYEREVIERWLEKSTTSPLTGLELPHRTLMENTAVKCAIAATMKQRQARK